MRSDGAVFVADASVPEVLVFGPNGRLEQRIGRRGSGPGEFQFIAGAGLLADTLWVWDSRTARLTLFDRTGRRITDRRLPTLLGVEERGTLVSIIGMRDKRELIVIRDPPGTEKQGGAFTRFTFVVDSTAQRIVDTLATTEISEAFASSPGAMFMLPFVPITDGAMQAVGGGYRVSVRRAVATSAERGEIVVRLADIAGDRVRELRIAYRPLLTPRDSLRRELETVLINDRRRAAAARAVNMPVFLPPVTALHVDEDGRVWLRREDFQRNGPEWLVLDSALRPLGTFRMPVLANSAQYPTMSFFWNHEEDDLGEPRVVGYAFPFSRTLR
jgi:hypothetical protein